MCYIDQKFDANNIIIWSRCCSIVEFMIYLCVCKSILKVILNILLIIDIKNENIIIVFYCYKNNTSQKKKSPVIEIYYYCWR
jgi:hypothetical protein